LADVKHSIDSATLINHGALDRFQLSMPGAVSIFSFRSRHEAQQLTYAQFLLDRTQLLLPTVQPDFNHNCAEGAT
jgi:hypothetical protein